MSTAITFEGNSEGLLLPLIVFALLLVRAVQMIFKTVRIPSKGTLRQVKSQSQFILELVLLVSMTQWRHCWMSVRSESRSMSRLTFGYALAADGGLSGFEHGVLAEKSGFHSIWSPDHLVDVDGDRLEPWTILSALAVRTKRVVLGSSVTDTQRCHPARTAHSVAILDQLSHGRALLGIGAGEAMNTVPFGLPWEPPSERLERLEEAIQVIKLLWNSSREEPVDFAGRFYQLHNAFISETPRQRPHPPIYVGAIASKGALRIVGRFGDGWHAWLNTPETFKKRWAIIKEAAESAGRSAKQIRANSHIMVAFPRNAAEEKEALLAGKAHLFVEKNMLRALGYATQMPQYQNAMVLKQDVAQIMKAAESVPEEFVHRVLAIGGIHEVEERIKELARVGVTHFVVGDLLAPRTVKRTLRIFPKIIKEFSG